MDENLFHLFPKDPRSVQILEERARALAHLVKKAEETEKEHLLVFFLAGERYAGPASAVQLTIPLAEAMLARVPCAPAFILGVANIRGRIYPVMDLARFLDLPPRPLPPRAHLLLVRSKPNEEGEAIETAVLLDDLPQVENLPAALVKPPGETVSQRIQPYVQGITPDRIVILDIEDFLLDPAIIVHEEIA